MVFLQLAGTTKDGCVSRYKDRRERATGGNRCKCLALPEAEHCCISILPPSAAPKPLSVTTTTHFTSLPKRAAVPGPIRCLPQLLFFFFFPRPTQPSTVRGKSLYALIAEPTTHPIIRLVTTTTLVLLGSCHRTVKGKQPSR